MTPQRSERTDNSAIVDLIANMWYLLQDVGVDNGSMRVDSGSVGDDREVWVLTEKVLEFKVKNIILLRKCGKRQ